MFAIDTVALSGVRLTADGYLVADARIARAGIYEYSGREVGRDDMEVVRVYRPESTVFARDAMASFANRPLTLQHPTEDVNASNWRQFSVGYTGDEVARDGEFVRVPLIVTDAEVVASIQAGTRELSCGYECTIEFKDGIAPDGTQYHAVMSAVKGNHVAIVDRGRAGSACRIGDSWQAFNDNRIGDKGKSDVSVKRAPATIKGNETMKELRKIVVDDLTIETTEQGIEAIVKLNAQVADKDAALEVAKKGIDDATEAFKKLKDDHAKAVKKLEDDHAKEIADLNAKIPTAEQLDTMAKDRTTLIETAKTLVPGLDCAKLSDAGIRSAVVAKKLGDEAVKDKRDELVAAQFDTLATLSKDAGSNSGVDPVRAALMGGVTKMDDARDKHLKEQSNAWQA